MRWKKREAMSLLAVSISSSAVRSGLRASAPWNPAMSTACCFGSFSTISTGAPSGAATGGLVMSSSPDGMEENNSPTSRRTSVALTAPKTARTPLFPVTQRFLNSPSCARFKAATDSSVPLDLKP